MGNRQGYELRNSEVIDLNIDDILNIVKTYDTFASTTASPSETLIVTFKDNNVTYDNVVIEKAFLKIFINPEVSYFRTPWSNNSVSFSYAGLYEFKVYRDRIKPLVDTGVCPFFVKFLGGNEILTYEQLKQLLQTRTDFNENNLLRNLLYLYEDRNNRPALNQNNPSLQDVMQSSNYLQTSTNYFNIHTSLTTIRFVFSMLEAIDKSTTIQLHNMLQNNSRSTNRTITDETWIVIFQIALACYALFQSKVTHNDLHANNVFVETLTESTQYIFKVQNMYYTFTTNKKAKLFDFDRAYSSVHGVNPMINSVPRFCESLSVCNKNIEQIDIVKVLCSLSFYYPNHRANIIDLFIPGNIPPGERTTLQQYWMYVFSQENPSCLLQQQRNQSVPRINYNKLLNFEAIISNIASKTNEIKTSTTIDTHNVNSNNLYVIEQENFDNLGNVILDKVTAKKVNYLVQSQNAKMETLTERLKMLTPENADTKTLNAEIEALKNRVKQLQDELESREFMIASLQEMRRCNDILTL